MPFRSAAPPTRPTRDASGGFTVTEMLVAMMLLTIGALALYHSMSASGTLAENGDRHATATRLAASELEKARALPYTSVAMKVATAGATYFEGATQVTDATNGRILPTSSKPLGGVTYEIERYVTWRSATVNGTPVSQAFKQVTVIVAWTDAAGSHDVRSSTALSRTTSP
ncbi:MAG: prepilin-type N-terminal cleavage/methylation domain-containing protein [Acidimicrobiales bacterium]